MKEKPEMKKYKSFRIQLLECQDSGNLEIMNPDPNDTYRAIIICHKYKTQCMSSVCKHERM